MTTSRIGRQIGRTAALGVVALAWPVIVAAQLPGVRCADGVTAATTAICIASHDGVAKVAAQMAWPAAGASANSSNTDTSSKNHNGTIELNSTQFGVSRSNPPAGNGTAPGKADLSDITAGQGKPPLAASNITVTIPLPDTPAKKPQSKKP